MSIKVSDLVDKLFLQYVSMSVGNMNNRAAGIRSRLPQWHIDNFFSTAIENAMKAETLANGSKKGFGGLDEALAKTAEAAAKLSLENIKKSTAYKNLTQDEKDKFDEMLK